MKAARIIGALMSTFSTPFAVPPPATDQASAQQMFAVLQQALAAAGVSMRSPPPQPTACCGRGCNGCVWEGFFAAAAYWREEALERLQREV